jgi:hypothetical protein
MLDLFSKDSLNEIQKIWFKAPRSTEEFYDVEKDPYETFDLIQNLYGNNLETNAYK